ncbi:MAG: hypothetical protein ACI8P0_002051 [Planctomycetaceae bacterium]
MTQGLAVPLLPSQIDSAQMLSQKLKGWMRSNRCLNLLHEQLPGFSDETVLLKTVAVNTLYGTNVYAVQPVAQHVCQVLQQVNLESAGPELVERLAMVRLSDSTKPRRRHSFASKFAHRFIDADRFPILDGFAETMVKRHLGNLAQTSRNERYVAFADNVSLLRELSGIDCSGREFDHYLWLAGAWRAVQNPKSRVSREVVELFQSTDSETCQQIQMLHGEQP